MPTVRPAILISYAYWAPWVLDRYEVREWVLDSGAYTAWSQGKPVDLQQYIDFCLEVRQKYPNLRDIFALDVIGDGAASVRNAEEMTRQGLTVIPTFHLGSPEEFLYELAAKYDKLALGGMVHKHGTMKQPKAKFAEQAFARVWPKKLHGFGLCSRRLIDRLPWHSVDFSNWAVDPMRFGKWRAYGKHMAHVSVRDHRRIALAAEVEHWYRVEAEVRRTRPEFTIYLAVSTQPNPKPDSAVMAIYDGAFPRKEQAA